MSKSRRSEAGGGNAAPYRNFLNQDCVDIVIEFAADSAWSIAVLRTVSWSFLQAVGCMLRQNHRSSGVPLDTLSHRATAPLVARFGGSITDAAMKLTALAGAHTIRRVEVHGVSKASTPFRYLPRLDSCLIEYGPDAMVQRALCDVAIHCRRLSTIAFGDINLAYVAPALKRMASVSHLQLRVNMKRMADFTVPVVLKPCGASLRRVTLDSTYLLNVPWSTCCPVLEYVKLTVANRNDFDELALCPRLTHLIVTGAHPPPAAAEVLPPLRCRSQAHAQRESEARPDVDVDLTYEHTQSAIIPEGYRDLVRTLRGWRQDAGDRWPRLRSFGVVGGLDNDAARTIESASEHLSAIQVKDESFARVDCDAVASVLARHPVNLTSIVARFRNASLLPTAPWLLCDPSLRFRSTLQHLSVSGDSFDIGAVFRNPWPELLTLTVQCKACVAVDPENHPVLIIGAACPRLVSLTFVDAGVTLPDSVKRLLPRALREVRSGSHVLL